MLIYFSFLSFLRDWRFVWRIKRWGKSFSHTNNNHDFLGGQVRSRERAIFALYAICRRFHEFSGLNKEQNMWNMKYQHFGTQKSTWNTGNTQDHHWNTFMCGLGFPGNLACPYSQRNVTRNATHACAQLIDNCRVPLNLQVKVTWQQREILCILGRLGITTQLE